MIYPCCLDIISNLFGTSECRKLKQVSLSNNTVKNQIEEISKNILSQLIQKVKNSVFKFFSIQLDETTDVSNCAQLCVFIRYINIDHFEDEFLFCETLNTRTTSIEIFKKVDEFFIKNDLHWDNVVGVCTDGVPSMLGCRSGFQKLVKEKIHRLLGFIVSFIDKL